MFNECSLYLIATFYGFGLKIFDIANVLINTTVHNNIYVTKLFIAGVSTQSLIHLGSHKKRDLP